MEIHSFASVAETYVKDQCMQGTTGTASAGQVPREDEAVTHVAGTWFFFYGLLLILKESLEIKGGMRC